MYIGTNIYFCIIQLHVYHRKYNIILLRVWYTSVVYIIRTYVFFTFTLLFFPHEFPVVFISSPGKTVINPLSVYPTEIDHTSDTPVHIYCNVHYYNITEIGIHD